MAPILQLNKLRIESDKKKKFLVSKRYRLLSKKVLRLEAIPLAAGPQSHETHLRASYRTG